MAEPFTPIVERFPLQVETERDKFAPESTILQNLSAGFSNGLKETTLGLAKDLKIKQEAKKGIDIIPQAEWNESHPYWVDGIDWHDELSTNAAKNIRDYQSFQTELQTLSQRASGGYSISQFAGTFLGAMVDPINIIPIGLGAGLVGKSLAVGLGNALLDTAIYAPLAEYTEEVRGRDLTFEDHALNAAFAFGAGAGLHAFGTGASKFIRAMGTTKDGNTNIKIQESKKHDAQIVDQTEPVFDINAAHSNGQAFKIAGTTNTSSNFIRNTSIDSFDVPVYVDSRGIIFANSGEGRIKLQLVDNEINLNGNLKNIARLLPTVRSIAPDNNIKIVSDARTEVLTAENIDLRINEIVAETKVETKLGSDKLDRFRIDVDKTKYDLEIDEVTGEVTAGYFVRANGRRGKKLKANELEAVKQGFIKSSNNNAVSPVGNNVRPATETSTTIIDDQRSGTQSTKQNAQVVQQTLKDTGGDEQAVVNTIRGQNFIANATPEKAMSAFLSQPIMSERTLREAGFRIVKEKDGNRTLIPIKDFDASKLDEEARMVRDLVVRFQSKLDELSTKTKSKKELNTCLVQNGL